jgi:hypothetical protein
MSRIETINGALRAMHQALDWVRDEYEPNDADMAEIRKALILALGGFLIEPSKPKDHPLDWSLMRLRAMQYDGAVARRLAEQFPGWQSHPSWPLSRWLKVADKATLLRVAAMLREIGQDI